MTKIGSQFIPGHISRSNFHDSGRVKRSRQTDHKKPVVEKAKSVSSQMLPKPDKTSRQKKCSFSAEVKHNKMIPAQETILSQPLNECSYVFTEVYKRYCLGNIEFPEQGIIYA